MRKTTDPYITKDSGEREKYESGAVRDKRGGKGRFDLITPIGLRRLAGVYERGAEKYAARNWEKGMPMSRFLDSALRHLNQYAEGLRDEDHLAQAAWNVFAMMHFEELRPDLNDLADYTQPQIDLRKIADCAIENHPGEERAS